MKILLLNPNRRPEVIGLDKERTKYFVMTASPIETFYMPDMCVELGYITEILRKKKHEVKIVDAQTQNISNDRLAKIIDDFRPDWIGISSAPLNIWRCYPLTDLHIMNATIVIKQASFYYDKKYGKIENFPKPKIILFGPHGSIFPERYEDLAEVVIRGEPEFVFSEIVDKYPDLGDIEGIAYWKRDWKGGKFIVKEGSNMVKDLDKLPPLPYDEIVFGEHKASWMITSRGCPFGCIFCCKVMPNFKYRMRSAKKVVDEIEFVRMAYGTRTFYFPDEVFTYNREHTVQLCNELINRKIIINWGFETRSEFLDRELMELLAEAGCDRIDIGMESGSAQILKLAHKGNSPEDAEKVIRWGKEAGITIRPFIILGLPGENEDTINETFEFLKKNEVKWIGCLLATPYSGTELYNTAEFNKDVEWDELAKHSGTVQNTFTRKGIRKALWNFRLRFYLWRDGLEFLYPLLKIFPLEGTYTAMRKAKNYYGRARELIK